LRGIEGDTNDAIANRRTDSGARAALATTVGTKRRSLRGWLAGIAVLLLFVGLLVSGILERIHTNASLRTETADLAVPTVSVVAPKRAAPSQEIVLPGNVQPYITSPVFARTNGIWSIGTSI